MNKIGALATLGSALFLLCCNKSVNTALIKNECIEMHGILRVFEYSYFLEDSGSYYSLKMENEYENNVLNRIIKNYDIRDSVCIKMRIIGLVTDNKNNEGRNVVLVKKLIEAKSVDCVE
ncbi:hypothetical protein [Sphingorhabdus sp.]|jgi:hypothetical protein|uniref:hypothetical protein n=1 Tax=Sphingorhabdus sp. TaxID=1902408 RepID=UPI003BB20EF3|nr:hypothetical protein [Sphingomonadales bacterium]MBK9431546.1 hypothetical protein [Sphingomonadales bacterium]MBL0023192.1 hypothetical protein [Sphingomonadales bacterium]